LEFIFLAATALKKKVSAIITFSKAFKSTEEEGGADSANSRTLRMNFLNYIVMFATPT
jgi:hypothetical protein